MKLYLVTGFLGAGKTTFLKNLVTLFSDQRLALIINEFGKEGVDGKLLSELNIHVSEINNGSIFCSCRLDKFEEVLQHIVEQDPEVGIIETSGLSDPTNIHKILAQNEAFSSIDYRGCLCLVDALHFEKVYRAARVSKAQVAVSDIVLINKCDLATEEQIAHTEELLLSHRPNLTLLRTSFGTIEPEWEDRIRNMTSLSNPEGSNDAHIQDITLKKKMITIKDGFTLKTFKHFLEMFLIDTYRIKGFVQLDDGIYLVDCVQNINKVTPYTATVDPSQLQKVVVLAGKGMPIQKAIQEAVNWYPSLIESVE